MKSKRVQHWAMMAAVGTSILTGLHGSKDASALMRTVHALNCRLIGTATLAPLTYASNGQVANANASAVEVICPVEGDPTLAPAFPKVTVGLYGYANAAAGIEARTCVTWWSGGGGYCDSNNTASSTGAGVQSLTVQTVGWTLSSGHDFAYVWVRLGGMISGSANVLFGSFVVTP
jgi:hypothetical protein